MIMMMMMFFDVNNDAEEIVENDNEGDGDAMTTNIII